MPLEKAVTILKQGAGTQWDADLVEAFLSILPDILKIRDSYKRPPLPVRKSQQIDGAPLPSVANAGAAVSADLAFVETLLGTESSSS
jgi:hypothetical protein